MSEYLLPQLMAVLFQLDWDAVTKVITVITFVFVALAAVTAAIYYIFVGQRRAILERTNRELTTENDLLRKRVDDRDKQILELEISEKSLLKKLKLERKIVLSQAAVIQGIKVDDDHFEDL